MTVGEIKRLYERLRRLQKRIGQKAGRSFEWEVEIPNSGNHKYRINGMKSPEEFEDDIAFLAVSIWSMKDYIKKIARSYGKSPRDVEQFVNSDSNLPICADLANTDKHGELTNSRTNNFLRMGRANFNVPKAAISRITLRKNEVEVDVSAPELVVVTVPILDQSATQVGEALACLQNSIAAWERLLRQFGVKM
jgi:hypothetical protein